MVGGDVEGIVVGVCRVLSKSFGQLVGKAFRHASGVDKNQRGVVTSNLVGQVIKRFTHLRGTRHGFEIL